MIKETGPAPEHGAAENQKYEELMAAFSEAERLLQASFADQANQELLTQLDQAMKHSNEAWDEYRDAIEVAHQREQAEE
ncbi:MAG: hypothetical protein A3J59_03250 [Candidatus Buchananbacteria bacterium RIFCSPHIGHO2_02_FULL_56_16]|uniref:Uncharacterized protein n=1 Tax=Candidatus Buchananbacteria bacterium RIFCSPHIGHO2_02_FULL_56_16 TaxID=1797542 RepID=A0A1G1YF33_9BACT|nr:MAG: hypothetical protein A3J59_03250 [Candidatus Buchananbacteria bacterium RIFCSPHIGHO2_02_FULL_56_16]